MDAPFLRNRERFYRLRESRREPGFLEGSRTIEVGDTGTTFTPSAEVGMRHDGGDAETGTGVVAGVGARLATPGVAVDVAVRSLVAHDGRDHEG